MRNTGGKKRGKKPVTGVIHGPRGWIITVLVIVLVLSFFLGLRHLYHYITESGDTGPVKGVDVSYYQPDIEWRGLKKEGISFAFIKASEGSSLQDPMFTKHCRRARLAGIRTGAYHFMSYDSSGKEQADNFEDAAGHRFGMMPPVIDVEFYGKYSSVHPSREEMYAVLDELIAELEERYHRNPVIYTNVYIYDTYIAGRYEDSDIWISSDRMPETLSDGRSWTFCQYTFHGRSEHVGNGEKNVDMNVFRGSKWDLRKYRGE